MRHKDSAMVVLSDEHLGGRITVSLVRGLDARLDVNSDTVGTTVTVDIPPET